MHFSFSPLFWFLCDRFLLYKKNKQELFASSSSGTDDPEETNRSIQSNNINKNKTKKEIPKMYFLFEKKTKEQGVSLPSEKYLFITDQLKAESVPRNRLKEDNQTLIKFLSKTFLKLSFGLGQRVVAGLVRGRFFIHKVPDGMDHHGSRKDDDTRIDFI